LANYTDSRAGSREGSFTLGPAPFGHFGIGPFPFVRRFTLAAFFCNSRHVSKSADEEFKLLLAYAFDRAWKRYYRPSRVSAISASVARASLAKHLIALAKKEGISVSVGTLAEAGFLHLVSLTPEAQHLGHLRITGARARFPRVWRVRVLSLARK
jgi:hypothetical protein